MTIRDETDPIKRNALHRITYTNGGNKRLNMAANSTQVAYLTEGARGNGFVAHFEFGHPTVVSSTANAETFITAQLGGSIP